MNAARLVALFGIGAGIALPRVASAQGRVTDLVEEARAELNAGKVDSGLALLRVALDSGTPATPAERVNALVWRGILRFFKGDDSLAHQSFREALTMDPRLEVAGLAAIDSGLATAFEAVRRTIAVPTTAREPSSALARFAMPTARASADSIYGCVPQCRGLDAPPRVLASSPTTELVLTPAALAATPMVRPGVALFRFIVDTSGAVEPLSVQVVTSPNPVLNDAFLGQIRAARFTPARVAGRAVRVSLQWRYTFRGQ